MFLVGFGLLRVRKSRFIKRAEPCVEMKYVRSHHHTLRRCTDVALPAQVYLYHWNLSLACSFFRWKQSRFSRLLPMSPLSLCNTLSKPPQPSALMLCLQKHGSQILQIITINLQFTLGVLPQLSSTLTRPFIIIPELQRTDHKDEWKWCSLRIHWPPCSWSRN